jgi:hypothetical protein
MFVEAAIIVEAWFLCHFHGHDNNKQNGWNSVGSSGSFPTQSYVIRNLYMQLHYAEKAGRCDISWSKL